MSLNQELSTLFQTLAAVLEIKGESVFKAIAFSKVGRIVGDMTADLHINRVEAGTLKDMPGIGDSSRKIIEEFVRTGRSTDAEELQASVPPGLLPLLEIQGLGPKTIHLLWKERNILGLEDLVKALDSGALAGLKGIGAKKIESIKSGIAMRAQSAGRLGLPDALAIGQSLLDRLRAAHRRWPRRTSPGRPTPPARDDRRRRSAVRPQAGSKWRQHRLGVRQIPRGANISFRAARRRVSSRPGVAG